MPGDFEQTHENILASAKENFMANGYELTNLRKICKDAGVTTGAFYRHFDDKQSLFAALVEPAVQEIKKMYFTSKKCCLEHVDTDELLKVWQVSHDMIEALFEYIYENFDSFKLLLMCSDAMRYDSFLEDLVDLEVSESEEFFRLLRERKVVFKQVPKKEFHMLIHSYFSSIFEVVTHNFTKEEALRYGDTLVTFYNAGWRSTLGI